MRRSGPNGVFGTSKINSARSELSPDFEANPSCIKPMRSLREGGQVSDDELCLLEI